MFATLLDPLLDDLARAPVAADATNQYAADDSPGNATRRANLRRALEQALAGPPTLLLVGEAPGYNGARRTGVPFTSERLLLAGVDPPGLFGQQRGFALATNDGRVSAEQTATLVWREVQRLDIMVLGWNAFPFHPHRADNPQRSNRRPRMAELRAGLPFLAALRAHLPTLPVVAMGNVAAQALTLLDVTHTRIRHPAQGGARQFAAGLSDVCATLR